MTSFAALASEIDNDPKQPAQTTSFADLAAEIDHDGQTPKSTMPEHKSYFAKVGDAFNKFQSAVDKENKWYTAPVAVGETALNAITSLPQTLLKHGIAEGAYIGGESESGAKAISEQLTPDVAYQPKTEAGKALPGLLGAALEPIPNAIKSVAGALGASEPMQDVAVDLAPAAVPIAKNIRQGLADMGAKWDSLVATGKATEAAPIAEAVPAGQVVGKAAEAQSLTFDESAAPTGKAAPLPAQIERAQVLKRIGIADDEAIRQSAVLGDAKAAKTDYQQSLEDSPAGHAWSSKIAAEREALANHAERIIQNTGGSVGTDQTALYSRGNAIVEPLDKLKTWFDQHTSALYKEADARAGNVPVELPNTQKFIGGDQAEFLGTTEGESLLKGVKARMRSLGMIDDAGSPQAVTVKQAEQLKQYLNNQWQPRTARLIRGLKDSLDDDVTSAAGDDVYQEARAMRSLRAKTLDDPNGIAKIMDSSGPDGLNRAIPIEKIPHSVTGLPADQLGHVIKTLKSVPPEIQPLAQSALAEIKSQFVNQALDIGQKFKTGWNEKGVTQFLNANKERIAQVFADDPAQIQALKDLNDAGHILKIDKSYPGAAVQANNLLKRGALNSLGPLGGVAGGAVGSVLGAPGMAAGSAIGGYAGNALSKSMAEKAALAEVAKRTVKLSDFAK